MPVCPRYAFSHDSEDVLFSAIITRLSGENSGRRSHWKDGNSAQRQSCQVCSKNARKTTFPLNRSRLTVSPVVVRAVNSGAALPTYGPVASS